MGVAWDTLLDGNVRTLIERDLLLPFLQRQRWFGGKARRRPVGAVRRLGPAAARRRSRSSSPSSKSSYDDGERDSYFLPLAICAAADARGVEERSPHAVLARVTGARKGVLFDAWLDDGFAPRAARRARAAAGRPDRAAARCGPVQTSGVRARSAARARSTSRRAGRRAEQHVARLRRSADPQAVPAPGAGHQPRLRDRPAPDRARRLHARAGRGRRARIPDDRRTSRRPSRCCSSSSRARPTAGRTRPTRSAASSKRSRAARRRRMPAPRLVHGAADRAVPSSDAIDAMAGYPATAETLGRRTGGSAPGARQRLRAIRRSRPEPFTADDLAGVRRRRGRAGAHGAETLEATP